MWANTFINFFSKIVFNFALKSFSDILSTKASRDRLSTTIRIKTNEYGRGKGFVDEGGIRALMIAYWPGHIKSDTTTENFSVHYDLMATTLGDIAGDIKLYNTNGVSFLPTLFSNGNQKDHDFLYWEFSEYGGQLPIRMGDWKVVNHNSRIIIMNPYWNYIT